MTAWWHAWQKLHRPQGWPEAQPAGAPGLDASAWDKQVAACSAPMSADSAGADGAASSGMPEKAG